ncbi:hypothetical protein [Streptomyces sp. NPDC056401]|uniref:hypothetical protein n=1 Tax=Streptomyces sp. NPDC056401 TaxID=3345809 RepID=UPI0035D6851A
MNAAHNTMSGRDWISESRHTACMSMAGHLARKHAEALASKDWTAAERHRVGGLAYLAETEDVFAPRVGGRWKPKRVVADEEALLLREQDGDHDIVHEAQEEQRRQVLEAEEAAKLIEIQDARALEKLKAKDRLRDRANPHAFHPYSAGLPTLGKDR